MSYGFGSYNLKHLFCEGRLSGDNLIYWLYTNIFRFVWSFAVTATAVHYFQTQV